MDSPLNSENSKNIQKESKSKCLWAKISPTKLKKWGWGCPTTWMLVASKLISLRVGGEGVSKNTTTPKKVPLASGHLVKPNKGPFG